LVAPLPFRLRSVLLLLLLVLLGAVTLPRVRAAYRLRSIVKSVADYGLCMAGPTGAVALRSDPVRFRALVRHRLVAAAATDRPFARCANLASALAFGADLASNHERQASEFIEWGAGGQGRSINEFFSHLPDLDALYVQAWPILHKPLQELMRSTRGAYEAVHPLELARPAPVQGLGALNSVMRSTVENQKVRYVVASNDREVWAYRSRDRGLRWASTSVNQLALEGHAEHCMAADGELRIGLVPAANASRPALAFGSLTGLGVDRREFGNPGDQVTRVACDASGAVALAKHKGDPAAHVYACPISGRCREMVLPALFAVADAFVDVARVNRTIVVVAVRDGLVRVTTSRDEGASSTPLSLVFDARAQLALGIEPSLVPNLFGFERQVELVLSNPSGTRTWGLVSNDAGASFHAFD
jgi:hypothetical protein